jgi:hypothetical protein
VVQPDERTASYEDLMKTPSGALGKNKGLFPSWSVFAISCVTLAAAGLLVWRKVASRKRSR